MTRMDSDLISEQIISYEEAAAMLEHFQKNQSPHLFSATIQPGTTLESILGFCGRVVRTQTLRSVSSNLPAPPSILRLERTYNTSPVQFPYQYPLFGGIWIVFGCKLPRLLVVELSLAICPFYHRHHNTVGSQLLRVRVWPCVRSTLTLAKTAILDDKRSSTLPQPYRMPGPWAST